MHQYLKSLVCVLVVLLAVCMTTQSHAKLASPPPQLTGIFTDFAEFEAAFKSDKWDDARKAAGKINSKFSQMLPQLKRDIKGEPDKTFKGIMGNVNQAVKRRDKPATEDLFIELHKFVLSLISNYDYKTPPIFILINKYIGEAEEALEQRKFDRVVSEMNEIVFLFTFAGNHLEDRDTRRKQIDEIKTKLQEIRSAAQIKRSDSVKSGIKSLKKMLSELLRIG